MHTTPRLLALFGALPFVAATLAPAPAAAQTSGVLNACVGKTLGTLRATDASQGCRPGETLISWNQQGPQGPQGPRGATGPAGPQFSLAAVVSGSGAIEALTAPPGASFTVTRVGPGVFNVEVTGLGTGCPLPTATAFNSPTPMYFGPGACGNGSLSIPVKSGNALNVAFSINVISQGQTTAAAAAPASRAVKATLPLGQP